jgi:hypothetical protein
MLRRIFAKTDNITPPSRVVTKSIVELLLGFFFGCGSHCFIVCPYKCQKSGCCCITECSPVREVGKAASRVSHTAPGQPVVKVDLNFLNILCIMGNFSIIVMYGH